MADKEENEKKEAEDSAPAIVRQKTVREVVVTHLDVPPPSGKRTIHPRRPAPVVPTREERTGKEPEGTDAERQDSE